MNNNKSPHKPLSANAYGHYRKRLSPTVLPKGFVFREVDGIKVLDEPSNCTVTSIMSDGPALQWELAQAMTYSQRSRKRLGHAVPTGALRQKFPTVDKFCDDDQIQEIACSEPGQINPHQHAVYILSERLQISPGTVDRYFRNPTGKKSKKNTKPSAKP